MDGWLHLRRKGEIGSGALLFRNNYAKLINDFGFTNAFKNRTHKAVRDHLGVVSYQKLCDSSDTVADDILKQLAGQPTYPMLLVSQQGPRIARICKVVTIVAFDMNCISA